MKSAIDFGSLSVAEKCVYVKLISNGPLNGIKHFSTKVFIIQK